MAFSIGVNCNLFYFAGLLTGTPTWVEGTSARDVTLNAASTEADVTTRAGGGFKLTAQALYDYSIDTEILYDKADAFFVALRNAFTGRTSIAIKCLDGGTSTTGQGLVADMAVVSFVFNEPMDGPVTVSVTLKPTESATAPSWQTGS